MHAGRLNTYSFQFKGKRVILRPFPPSSRPRDSDSMVKTTLLVDYEKFFKDTDDNDPIICLTTSPDIPTTTMPPSMTALLDNMLTSAKIH